MKTPYSLALFLLAPAALSQAALEPLWVQQIVGGVSQGGSVAADGTGGVLLTGKDSGPFGSPPPGGEEVFVARYEADGTPRWIERFGSTGLEHSLAILADGTGGAFVAGRTQGDLARPLEGLSDAFIARYGSDGTQLWILQAGSTGGDGFVSLASDGMGGCYALGQTTGAWAGQYLGGPADGVLMHYDANGALVWGTQFGTAGNDYALSVAEDGAGNALVAGWVLGGTFPGNPMGSGPSFLARFDATGTLTSAVQYGPTSDQPIDAVSDGSGGAFVAGITVTGTTSLTIEGFVEHVDPGGNSLWRAPVITASNFTVAEAIDLSAAGEPVIVATGYNGFISPGTPSILTPTDGLVRRYSSSGTLLSSDDVGGPGSDQYLSVAVDGDAGVWLGGNTTSAFGGPSHSGYQLFAARHGFVVGARYCTPAVANSTGAPGRVIAAGSETAAEGALTLVATDLPNSTFGYFITSQSTGLMPMAGGGQGTLCLGGSIGRYNRPGEVGATGSIGSFALTLDLASVPQPTGSVPALAGETWNFQAWYRDANPATTSNFTDAVGVTFQ